MERVRANAEQVRRTARRLADAAGDRGNTTARTNQLNAYRNEVEAQRGKAISDANATALLALVDLL